MTIVVIDRWNESAGLEVLADLDEHDRREVEVAQGGVFCPRTAVMEWTAAAAHGAQVGVALSLERLPWQPFAVVGLFPTGMAGVMGAAMLARDHRRFRRPLVRLVRQVRLGLPGFAAASRARRLEARSWMGHPTGHVILRHAGFRCDAILPGHGPEGRDSFALWSWTDPECNPEE